MSCIYAIWFPASNDNSVYIGQTKNLDKRSKEHLYKARCGYKGSPKLHNWIRARLDEGFDIVFETMQECEPEDSNRLEDVWQTFFKEFGWNCKHLKGGENQTGYVFTEEHKAKLSEAAKKRIRQPMSDETKRKVGDANRGHVKSPELLERMSQNSRGKKQSPETIAKRMAAIEAKGTVWKRENYAKVSKKATGRKASPETLERQRVSQTGKKHSEETKRKLSELRQGVSFGPRSQETKQKISESNKGKTRSSEQVARRSATINAKSEEEKTATRLKMSESHKGLPWSKERREAHERRKAISENNT